ncbi:KAP family P-loop NTPase fold protein [Paenibacillus phocaensis]|uniref:KAP family P-loop NTPase fold protein n=1 Tax=Paenibacillus phocaensis TaxID=1776378 RepID=UPI000839CAF7|nr:P-loop NTPase fold protein [Paenibacillus phocaensis]
MFNSDIPIKRKEEDSLGRTSFSHSLGQAFLRYTNPESFVVGLYGSWGTGKTSIINLCLEFIEDQQINLENRMIILKFNPWNYSDQNQLIQQFFNEMIAVIKKKTIAEKAKMITQKILSYSRVLKPLKYIPVVGQYSELGSDIAEVLKEDTKELSELKNEINELLLSLEVKVLIIIDDIDRLNRQEIKQIFQLIKSLGDFNNTIYLVAFDKDVVVAALEELQGGSGDDYLEKIIQVPIAVPAANESEMEEVFFSKLNSIINDIPEESFDITYWGNVYLGGIKQFIKNMRDINRFCNVLSFSFEMIKDDVNPVDLISIVAIQVFLPDLYHQIRENKGLFIETIDSFWNIQYKKDEMKKKYDEIISSSSEGIEITELLKRIFLRLEEILGGTRYDSGWQSEWRKQKRICSSDYFDNYFRLTLAKEEIPSQVIKTAIYQTAINKFEFKEFVQGLINDNRINRFLEKIVDYIDIVPIENIKIIASVLLDLGDSFPEKTDAWGFIDSSFRLSRVLYNLFWRFDILEKREEIILEVIQSCNNSIYSPSHFLSYLRREYGTDERPAEPKEKQTMSEEKLTNVEAELLSKIIGWSKDKRLIEHKKFASLLFCWKRYGEHDLLNSYLNELKNNDRDLVVFISHFVGEGTVSSLGDYVGRRIWKINKKNIGEFFDLDELTERISNLKEDVLYSELNAEEKRAIELFLQKSSDDIFE